MKVEKSNYLLEVKPKIQQLISLLEKEFDYVSVLATDVSGTSYRVGQKQTSVGDYRFGERGFVVRVYLNGTYLEYSFNQYDDVKQLAKTITTELKKQLTAMETLGIAKMESPLILEEQMEKEMVGEIEINPEEVSAEDILAHLKKVSNKGAAHEGIIEFQAAMQFAHVNKMFLSKNKNLMQSYAFAEGMAAAIGAGNDKTDMAYRSFSGLKGAEILDEMDSCVEDVIKELNDKLNATPVVPGIYDVVVSPEVAGLIAHEAFGHGVEMDMFVKNRALAKDYIGKPVASEITSMKDGALSAAQVSSYLFDDEGTLGKDTTIIENGI